MYDGPLIGAISLQAPIFSTMESLRDRRIGYMRGGGRAPVDPSPVRASNCEGGWYRLLAGGYICGKHATLDLNHPQVRLGITAPSVDDVLPYRYGSNLRMGTPLYRSIPTRESMLDYEPYLRGKSNEPVDDNPYAPVDAGTDAESKRPWWLAEPDAGKIDVKLSDLTEGADRVVAKRMFKGYYVAIDREFPWHGRTWYKTTNALVAPADRMALAKPSLFHGVDLRPPAGSIAPLRDPLDGGNTMDAVGTEGAATEGAGTQGGALRSGSTAVPVAGIGFVLSTHGHRYVISGEGKSAHVRVDGNADRYASAPLTGRIVRVAAADYRETTEGWWLRSAEGTFTEPGPAPAGLLPQEKWIDVNLRRQTLVAFEGDRMVYATLVSSGRRAKDPLDKVHDHQTVKGTFRIREKHIATTMDGDGPAPGDMPYSIEDVPYVQYFEGSYALHGAFWHNAFGSEHSHGCVNLAPLDAKQLFFWTDPPLPQGWHGVLSQKENPGTWVVVHD